MDNHPIPQDVTGFQFRLIGDMTVKQFAYVAVGGIFTIVSLYAPIPVLFRVPLMLLSAGLGLALAFMPLEGRPLDVMVSYFIKALIIPNQYAYHKNGGLLSIFGYQSKPIMQTQQATAQTAQTQGPSTKAPDKEKKLQTYLANLHSQNLSPLEKREVEFMQRLFPQGQQVPPQPQGGPPVTPPIQNQNSPEQSPPETEKHTQPQTPLSNKTPQETSPVEKTQDLALQENVLEKELDHAMKEEQTETDNAKKQEAHTHVTELENQLREIQNQKQSLETELSELKTKYYQMQAEAQANETSQSEQQMTQQQQPTPQTQQPQPMQEQGQQASVRKIPAEMAKSLGLPHIPDVPNLILGIVKDPRGNVLSNILVEVKDQDGTPARAFRTNQLGQFASATPLSQGTYTIEFEDPKGQHLFDTIEMTANNEILMPIEVISHDEREELRKALFN